MTPTELDCAERVSRIMRYAYDQGINRTGGNVSARVTDKIVVTPKGASADYLGSVPTDKLSWLYLDGSQIDGPEYSRDTTVHLEMYRRYSDFNGIVHAHPRCVLAFSTCPHRLNAFTQSARVFGSPIVCEHDPKSGVSLASAIASMADTQEFASKRTSYGVCVFVPHHGVFVASNTVEKALYYVNKLEENAQILLFQRLIG